MQNNMYVISNQNCTRHTSYYRFGLGLYRQYGKLENQLSKVGWYSNTVAVPHLSSSCLFKETWPMMETLKSIRASYTLEE